MGHAVAKPIRVTVQDLDCPSDKFLRKVADRLFGVALPEKDATQPVMSSCPRMLLNELNARKSWKSWWPNMAEVHRMGDLYQRARLWQTSVRDGSFERTGDRATLYRCRQWFADEEFERKLYLIRKRSSHLNRGNKELSQRLLFYICSLSTKTMIYKGMLTPDQVMPYYPDLCRRRF